MPQDGDPPSIGEQLADALRAADVSQKELARRLAGSSNDRKIETKRRWVGKVMKNSIQRPGMAGVERALSLPPGHFRLPPREQAQRQRDRLAEVEEGMNRLAPALRALTARVAALERQAPPKTGKGGSQGGRQ